MFALNYGGGYGNGGLNVWNSYQAQPTYNYSPWSSWTNNFTNTGTTPYGYGSYQYNLDRFDSGGVGNTQTGNNINQQSDYMRRLKVLQALGPGAEARIPNWRTMPFNDFLLAAARLKGVKLA